MKKITGKNGGELTITEKGEQVPGGGKPGPKKPSFKRIFKKMMKDFTIDEETGNKLTQKELAALKILGIAIGKTSSDEARMKAFQIIRDTIGEKPTDKQELTGKDGAPLIPAFPTEVQINVVRPSTVYTVDDSTNTA